LMCRMDELRLTTCGDRKAESGERNWRGIPAPRSAQPDSAKKVRIAHVLTRDQFLGTIVLSFISDPGELVKYL
jgi:hypothetical protein